MKKILVGNLDFSTTEQSLRSAFEPYGAVEHVSFATAGGFALIEMKDSRQANRALAALDGTKLTAESEKPLFLVAVGPEPRRSSRLSDTSEIRIESEKFLVSPPQRAAPRTRSRLA